MSVQHKMLYLSALWFLIISLNTFSWHFLSVLWYLYFHILFFLYCPRRAEQGVLANLVFSQKFHFYLFLVLGHIILGLLLSSFSLNYLNSPLLLIISTMIPFSSTSLLHPCHGLILQCIQKSFWLLGSHPFLLDTYRIIVSTNTNL